MDEVTEYALEAVVSGDEAEKLAADLLSVRGNPLSINAKEVTRIDTPCLTVLMAAKKLWADEDCELKYSSASDAFDKALATLGIEKWMMETGEA